MKEKVERKIKSVRTVTPQRNSPTHKVGLVLEPGNWEEYDPFLLLAEDWFHQGTFGLHPHRGIETVTYVIEGNLEHFDNKAGKGKLASGDVQWMTAGRGVIHKEDPAQGEEVHSLQLWVNLPSELKMIEPRYQNLRSEDMPVKEVEGAIIRVFSGAIGDITAPTLNYVPITMAQFDVDQGVSIEAEIPSSYNGFIYILEGSGIFGQNDIEGKKGQVLWLDNLNGEAAKTIVSTLQINATSKLRFLLYAGKPVKEKVVARGPFVMNTMEEIRQAYKDYTDGKFTD